MSIRSGLLSVLGSRPRAEEPGLLQIHLPDPAWSAQLLSSRGKRDRSEKDRESSKRSRGFCASSWLVSDTFEYLEAAGPDGLDELLVVLFVLVCVFADCDFVVTDEVLGGAVPAFGPLGRKDSSRR
jgi:hypothetical protein